GLSPTHAPPLYCVPAAAYAHLLPPPRPAPDPLCGTGAPTSPCPSPVSPHPGCRPGWKSCRTWPGCATANSSAVHRQQPYEHHNTTADTGPGSGDRVGTTHLPRHPGPTAQATPRPDPEPGPVPPTAAPHH